METQGGVLTVSLESVDISLGQAADCLDLSPGAYLLLGVSDTGCGMIPEVRDRIFDPYFTTKEDGKGTGLGLAVVYSIVQACKGAIRVTSAPGHGACFSVWLPVSRDSQDREQSPAPVLDNILGSGEQLVVVDDDVALLEMYREGFELLGYSPVVFSSSLGALEFYEEHFQGIDVVILDQTMPGMTGIQLAERMRAIRGDLPIILCSGYDRAVTKEMLEKSGIERYLSKPVGMDVLSREIQCMLGGSGKSPCPFPQKTY
ncbi:MAG: response regulator [Desulfovibrionales bacterium]|nr:response regulator [Desulfovibrionales bacterium]